MSRREHTLRELSAAGVPLADELAALVPHVHRPIRAFLRAPGDDGAEAAFWFVVYPIGTAIDHATARRVERELEQSSRLVADVLRGWKPEALAHQAVSS